MDRARSLKRYRAAKQRSHAQEERGLMPDEQPTLA
jgi:hypothetical protein